MKIKEEAALVLIPDAIRQSHDAFTDIYQRYHGSVRAVLFRFGIQAEREDLVQEVFLKAFRARADFREDSSPKTWILSIAINVAKDFLRKKRPVYVEAALETLQTATRDPDFYPTIEKALLSLDLPFREIIILCSIEGYSMQETAEILGIPEGTVKSRLASAREKMRTILAESGIVI